MEQIEIGRGTVVDQKHRAEEPQRWFRTLSTATRTNFAVMSDGFECRRAILSDCLEQQFEMVARPRFEPINRIPLHS
jgi:hypothetical protein